MEGSYRYLQLDISSTISSLEISGDLDTLTLHTQYGSVKEVNGVPTPIAVSIYGGRIDYRTGTGTITLYDGNHVAVSVITIHVLPKQ